MASLEFPLPLKVEKARGFGGKNLLIAAPTATGKNKMEMNLLFHHLSSKPAGAVNTYLVPYRALARELFAAIVERG